MLFTEFNLDDAIAVRYEEGLEEGLEDGLEQGLEQGRANEKLDIAQNLLAKGLSSEFVHEITGLDFEVIQKMR